MCSSVIQVTSAASAQTQADVDESSSLCVGPWCTPEDDTWSGTQAYCEAGAKSPRPILLPTFLFLGSEARHAVSKATTFDHLGDGGWASLWNAHKTNYIKWGGWRWWGIYLEIEEGLIRITVTLNDMHAAATGKAKLIWFNKKERCFLFGIKKMKVNGVSLFFSVRLHTPPQLNSGLEENISAHNCLITVRSDMKTGKNT